MADDDKKKPAPQKPIEKRKEKKPKVDPSLKARIDSIDDGVFDANKNLDSLIAKTGNASNRAEQRAGWVEFVTNGTFHSTVTIDDRVFTNVEST